MQRIPSLIQWHEGMFLSPQHFQQLQRRIEGELSIHTSIMHNHAWGIAHLKYDTLALSDGILQVSELKAIMPDNTLIAYPDEGGHIPLQIDLKPYRDAAMKGPIKVYLSVPEHEEGRSPVMGEWPRYVSVVGEQTMDENVQDNVVSIPRLHPKVSLIVGDTYPARYVSFPLCELIHRDEMFIFTDFQPPLLRIDANSDIHDRAVQIIVRMREKAQFLSDKWQKQIGTTLLTETANQLRPLIKVLPIMEGRLRGQHLAPRDFYDLLCFVFGELSTMRLTLVPPLLPMYQHDNVNQCLGALFMLIEQLLDSIEQSILLLPFSQRDRLFYIKFHESFFTKDLYIGLRAPSTMTEEMLYEWVKDAVIASDSTVESARSKRIVGAPRRVLDQEEMNDFLTARGTLVFKVQYPSEFLKAGENLNIFNASDDDDKRPTSIVLYLKNKNVKYETAA